MARSPINPGPLVGLNDSSDDAEFLSYSGRSKGALSEAASYDPMRRINDFNMSSSYKEELLSEFDTEEARLLRALEEKVFEDVMSESYHQSDDEFEFGGVKSEANNRFHKDQFEFDDNTSVNYEEEDDVPIPKKRMHHGSLYDKIESMTG